MNAKQSLPTFSGYCPPGQLRSMSRQLAGQALEAQARRMRRADTLTLTGLVVLLVLAACTAYCFRPVKPATRQPDPCYAALRASHGTVPCSSDYPTEL